MQARTRARGSRVSDSILYLAIVAIWAGFLIPAWVRRPHAAKTELDAETAEYEVESDVEVVSVDFEADVHIDADVHLDAEGENSEYRYDVHMHSYRAVGSPPAVEPAPRLRPHQSREQMMR